MKKIIACFAIFVCVFNSAAQFDLSCLFEAYTEGESIDVDPMDGRIVITNEGLDIPSGDSIFCGYWVNGEPYSLELDAGSFSAFEIEETFEAGASLTFGDDEVEWFELGLEVDLCAVVYGVGPASVPEFLGDTDTSNNTACIIYTLPHPNAGIDAVTLGSSISNVYTLNGQLMIVNNLGKNETPVQINVLNLNGQIIQSESVVLNAGTTAVEMNNVAHGVYFVAIEMGEGILTRKVVF